jgi:hypothetical protein
MHLLFSYQIMKLFNKILYQQLDNAKEDASVETIQIGIRNDPSNDSEQEGSSQEVCGGG